MRRYLIVLCVLLFGLPIVQAQGVTDYTTPDDALIFTAPEGYTMEITDFEALEAYGLSYDPATTPLQITLEPVDGMTANIAVSIYYGQPLDSFFGQFLAGALEDEIVPSEAAVSDVLTSIGVAFEMAAPENIVIETMTLADGTEIVYYDYTDSVTDEELGEIDMGEAMDNILGSAGEDAEIEGENAGDAIGELFGNVDSPFGQGMFESISETTRFYGLNFENTGPVIMETSIGSSIEGGEGALGGMNDFMAALDGDIPAVMEAFVNNVQAGTGVPIYVEETDEAEADTADGGQQTGEFAYTPPPAYAVLQADDGNIILSNDPNGSVDDQIPAAGTVRIVIQYGQPLVDSFAESGITFSDAASAAAGLANVLGTSSTPTTIGATETQNVAFDAGMFAGSYYLFDHPAVGTVLVAATGDAETLAAAQRDIILLIVSMQ